MSSRKSPAEIKAEQEFNDPVLIDRMQRFVDDFMAAPLPQFGTEETKSLTKPRSAHLMDKWRVYLKSLNWMEERRRWAEQSMEDAFGRTIVVGSTVVYPTMDGSGYKVATVERFNATGTVRVAPSFMLRERECHPHKSAHAVYVREWEGKKPITVNYADKLLLIQ